VSDFLAALRPLFDCLTDGVCVSDSEGRPLYANDAAGRLLGPGAQAAARNALCGPLCGALDPEAAEACPLKVPRGAHDAVTVKGFYGPTGRELRARCLRVRLPSRELRLLIIEDVSAQAEAGRRTEEWRRMLAHDFRSPLTIALGTLRAVEDLGPGHLLSPEDLALIQGGVRNCRRLEALISAYLDTTRLEDGAMPVHAAAVEIDRMIASVVEELAPEARRRGQELAFAPIGAGAACVDEELLRRALANIVGNALKFTPAGGKITVKASTSGPHVLIRTTDDGPGISPAELPHIFDRYYQGTKGERGRGLGLGLTFCRAALGAMGGDVSVVSKEGEGSVFTLRLPRAAGVSP
jgi:signal transduction histidine kinase